MSSNIKIINIFCLPILSDLSLKLNLENFAFSNCTRQNIKFREKIIFSVTLCSRLNYLSDVDKLENNLHNIKFRLKLLMQGGVCNSGPRLVYYVSLGAPEPILQHPLVKSWLRAWSSMHGEIN